MPTPKELGALTRTIAERYPSVQCPVEMLADTGVEEYRIFNVNDSWWSYVARVRIQDGRTVWIDCETQWCTSPHLKHSKNGIRWGLNPHRTHYDAACEMCEHALDVFENSKEPTREGSHLVTLERARNVYGLAYRCLCECGQECLIDDPYFAMECAACKTIRRSKASAIASRILHRSPSDPRYPRLQGTYNSGTVTNRVMTCVSQEPDIKPLIDTKLKEMQKRFPFGNITRAHAIRALIRKGAVK